MARIPYKLILIAGLTCLIGLAACQTGDRATDGEVILKEKDLAFDWYMHIKNKGCEYTTLKRKPARGDLNWHPSALQNVFPECVARYTQNVDLLILDCKQTRMNRFILYSRKKTACRFHQDNR